MSDLPEVWLRGPVRGVPSLLQPVAHALLEAIEEVDRLMVGFPERLLWTRPGGTASVGFHLRHLRGVLDRLFTYARGKKLSTEQLAYLRAEAEPPDTPMKTADLVSAFHGAVERALDELKQVDVATLTDPRSVGRAELPSTRLGLYVHAAEHTMRHLGQLLVTVRIQHPGEANEKTR